MDWCEFSRSSLAQSMTELKDVHSLCLMVLLLGLYLKEIIAVCTRRVQ